MRAKNKSKSVIRETDGEIGTEKERWGERKRVGESETERVKVEKKFK